MATYSSEQILNLAYNTTLSALNIGAVGTAPQAYGTDATGADTYATVITATAARTHIYIHNAGTHPAIISLDGGTTGHFYIPGNAAATFDGVLIANGANIQAKNGSAGNNYTSLYITIW